MGIFEEEEKTHESYGLVQFSRINGKFDNLFGSNVETGTAIALKIKRCTTQRSLSKTWNFGGEELIEVMLSPNQFSELLTTMNYGSGVPCTIQRFDGKRMDEPPREESEPKKAYNEFEKQMQEVSEKMEVFSSKIEEIMSKKSILKADREEVVSHIRSLHMEIASNFPFVAKQFQRSTEKIVRDAKSTVDAFVTSTIAQAGIKAIEDNNGIVKMPLLEDSKDGSR